MSITKKERPEKASRTIVFATFESEFAPCGGLAAVMKIFPKRLAESHSCFTMAPYFRNITSKKPAAEKIRDTGLSFSMDFDWQKRDVRILEHVDDNGYRTFLLDSAGYFTAPRDPYINPGDSEKLLLDSLFFCAAFPRALVELGQTSNLVLHLQDWETSAIAHTVNNEERIVSAGYVQTLHNPYDRGISSEQAALIGAENLPGMTVLSKMIPLMSGKLSTVSENFADELTSEPLHKDVFADHLQPLFLNKGLVGVDNGIFGELEFPFSKSAFDAAVKGDFSVIQREKWDRRIRLGEKITSYLKSIKGNDEFQTWGSGLELSDPAIPVFFFLGRDDPRQKGYDVAAEAISSVPPGKARYIFTPMPGDEGFEGLGFLKRLAEERSGEVMVFPFRMDFETFVALQQGSSYMVMCSLYEPFGGANEAYLAGMPVVARATGGLIQQVFPYDRASLGTEGEKILGKYHQKTAKPTGLLYREDSGPDAAADWQRIVDCAYQRESPMGDRIADRSSVHLWRNMVEGASHSLKAAIDLYTSNQASYAEMIFNGYSILSRFSWDRAIEGYQRLYDEICVR